jgi:hypothetical protein
MLSVPSCTPIGELIVVFHAPSADMFDLSSIEEDQT